MENHPHDNTGQQGSTGCGICLSDRVTNGVQLRCGHIFCHLCIKNASETTGVCALCRAEIGIEFNFQEHNNILGVRLYKSSNGFYWFYEGYQGWWLFDEEPNNKLEEAYQRGDRELDLYLAGSGGVYEIDLINMIQKRKEEEGARERKICRSTLWMDNILGLAGLKGKDISEALDMMRDFEAYRNPPPPM